MGGLGLPEIIIIGLIALLVFGPKKLPDLGAGLGKAIRDFKGALSDKDEEATPADKENKADMGDRAEKKEEPQPR